MFWKRPSKIWVWEAEWPLCKISRPFVLIGNERTCHCHIGHYLPFFCLRPLSHISIFLCLLFFVFLVFILLALDFANVLFYGKPAGANFLLHLSLFPQFAFSLITLFSMLTFVFIAQLHCWSIFSLLSKPLTTFQSYVYVPKQLHLSSIFVCDTLSIACFVQAHIQFYYSIYVSNLWLASTVLIS